MPLKPCTLRVIRIRRPREVPGISYRPWVTLRGLLGANSTSPLTSKDTSSNSSTNNNSNNIRSQGHSLVVFFATRGSIRFNEDMAT